MVYLEGLSYTCTYYVKLSPGSHLPSISGSEYLLFAIPYHTVSLGIDFYQRKYSSPGEWGEWEAWKWDEEGNVKQIFLCLFFTEAIDLNSFF